MIEQKELYRRIHACWLGKNIGGTLGGPHEGKPGPLNLDFYDPVPTRVLPNDDLDLQIVWLHHLRSQAFRTVTPEIMAAAWRKHVFFPFDEYGIARRNDAYGLTNAARGSFDNYFGESMGAAIRSELWACISPGDPARAAAFAWADAVVDHCGEGVYAEVFHAALQSAAFIENDRDALLATAMRFLPPQSRLHAALTDTIQWWHALKDWRDVRSRIVERYATGNFTDVVCNLCFEILGWLAGEGDFGRSICIAVNCGLDTDCTGATLGALLGIVDPDCIPEKWCKPIGDEVLLSKEIVGVDCPRNLDELTVRTLELREQLKDAPVVFNEVLPRRPADGRDRIKRSIEVEEIFVDFSALKYEEYLPAMTAWSGRVWAGHWQLVNAVDFTKPTWLMRITIEPRGEALKIMAFYRHGVTVWVNGKRSFAFTEADFAADPFVAPSFHRAGRACRTYSAGELPKGPVVITLALERPPEGKPADLIFGVGDPLTNLWIPSALSK